jgi:hypothetical protein
MHLCRLQAPTHLTLVLRSLDVNLDAAVALLEGLDPDLTLSISVGTDEQLDTFNAAWDYVQDTGLLLPGAGVWQLLPA